MPKITLEKVDALIFDFDGVLTDNKVYVDQDGKEIVSCSRSDGLGFDVLRRLKIPVYIFSTESNPIVAVRANKLKIPVFQGIKNKADAVLELANEKDYQLRKILYVGNDLNDYKAMIQCGYSVCPSDSHPMIKKIANIVLKKPGGDGVVRELLEDILQLDVVKILYSD